MRTILVHLGDTHHGLRNGLLAPGTEVEFGDGDKRILELSSWSDWLWTDVIQPGITLVGEIAAGDPVYLLHDGDAVHGHRFVEHQYSAFIDNQIAIALGAFSAWRRLPTMAGFALVPGTGAHDYGENAATKLLAESLAAWGLPVMYNDHIDLNIDGYNIDLAHHGPTSSDDPRVRGNAARTYARRRYSGYLERGLTPPSMIQRGHIHIDVYEPVSVPWANGYHETMMLVTPPLCGPNGYARQASRSVDMARCGFFVSEIEDGRLVRVHKHLVERTTRKTFAVQHVRKGAGNWSKGDGEFG